MPWTKWSLYPSWKWVTIAAWWWLYCIPLSKKETFNILNIFSPSTMTWRIFTNQTMLSFICEVDTTDLSIPNVGLKYLIFIYLFFCCIKKWPTKFKMGIHCYLHCSRKEINTVVTLLTSTREINDFQWKRIVVTFIP